jgi:hypothetical protein
MKRAWLLAGVVALAGCVGVVGPRQRSLLPDPVDDPALTLGEQARKARDRLAYPSPLPTAEPPRTALDPYASDRYGR